MFNHYNRDQIRIAWNKFLNEEPLEECTIRKEILDSWIRSKNYGVNWEYIEKKVLDKKELSRRIYFHKDMVDIALSVMETIYDTVKHSGFLVVLTDEEGYVLKIIGDEDIFTQAQAQENILIEGANRSEKYIGTNGIGISICKDIPIQVWADEHYYKPHRNWACSAAPIHDLKGNIIGCLNLSGPWDKAHPHSLGMVVAGVKAIEKQMQIQNAYHQIQVYNNQLNSIINSIPYGTICFNHDGIITQINNLAISIFHLKNEKIIGEDIDEIFKYNKKILDLKSINSNIYDKELMIETKSKNVRCSVSITIVKDSNGNKNGFVLTIKENKFVHKLINKMTTSFAEYSFDDIMGNSQVMKQTKRLARIASESNSTVLLLGESGTGKELFAQSIHNNSARSQNPFIALNCGALPRSLIESELFGYEGGAFTGAKKEGRPGKFELANGGTIFLDEIGDLPLDIQVTLLRVLQNREVTRIGGTKNIKINVRVIAATNKNLEELIKNKMFREDLYYRLNVLSINIPPLRKRGEDIKHLANFFLSKYNQKLMKQIMGFEEEVYKIFLSYNWPGNVRELENVVERAVNIADHNLITIYDLPIKLQKNFKELNPVQNKNQIISDLDNQNIKSFNLKELEMQAIIGALKKHNGNVKKASEELGIGRRTIYRKFNEYNIDYTLYRTN